MHLWHYLYAFLCRDKKQPVELLSETNCLCQYNKQCCDTLYKKNSHTAGCHPVKCSVTDNRWESDQSPFGVISEPLECTKECVIEQIRTWLLLTSLMCHAARLTMWVYKFWLQSAISPFFLFYNQSLLWGKYRLGSLACSTSCPQCAGQSSTVRGLLAGETVW